MSNNKATAEQRMKQIDQAFVGQPFWSLLRVYVGFKLFDGQSAVEGSQTGRIKSAKTWSLKQLLSIFIRKKYLFIGNASDLLVVNGHVSHRLFYSTIKMLGESNCNVLLKGANRQAAPAIYGSLFVFEATSFVLAQILKPFIYFRYANLRKKLLKFHVDLNVSQIISYHVAAYWLWKSHFCIGKPKQIFLSDWYNAFQMAIIRAAKEAGIETIEFQHGMLSPGHYGYFYYSREYDAQFNADRFFCFGSHFTRLLASKSVYRPEQMVVIGHPTLDLYQRQSAIITTEKQIVLVTLQDLILDQTLAFIQKTAEALPQVEFWLLPRTKVPQILQSNVKVLPPGKFYDWIQQVNVHVTVFSSTAYEALYFGCPNILLNIENYAVRFMDDLIRENTSTIVVNTLEEFVGALDSVSALDRQSVLKSAESYFSPEHQLQLRKYFQPDRPI